MRRPAWMTGLIVALAASSCRPGPVRQPDLTPLPAPEAVLADLRAKAGQRQSMRTLGRVTYFGDKGRIRLKAVLLARRPAAFRVETLSPFEQPVDVMASDGTQLWLLSKDRLRVGPATPENIARLLPLVMGPEAVVDTLLGGIPSADRVQADAIVRDEDGHWLLSVTGQGGVQAVLVVDPEARRVDEMRLLGPRGENHVRVRFRDFEALDTGGELPQRIEIQLEGQDSEVEIKLGTPEVNVELADGLFRIDAPPGVTPEPLDAS